MAAKRKTKRKTKRASGTRAKRIASKRNPRAASGRASKRSAPSRSRRWSGAVTRDSDALELEPSVFRRTGSAAIAASLKRSAEASRRRKGTPFQSAMSMLNFYINRGGVNLTPRRKAILQRAKGELRKAFHRDG